MKEESVSKMESRLLRQPAVARRMAVRTMTTMKRAKKLFQNGGRKSTRAKCTWSAKRGTTPERETE